MNNYQFEGQKEGEEVILVLRRHPWVLTRSGGRILIVALAVVALIFIVGASRLTSWAIAVGVVFSLLYGAYSWFCWWNTIFLLSNHRVIAIWQRGLFSRQVTEANLDRIQNVTTDVRGAISTFLNFGTINIQTAADQVMVAFRDVEDPYTAQQKIVEISHEYQNAPRGAKEKVMIR